MTLKDLMQLTRSLSGAEKRHFKLSCSKHPGNRDYLNLYTVILKHDNEMADVRETFKKKFPEASLNNAIQYLSQMILDVLIDAKMEKDNFFSLMKQVMEVRVLQERSLIAPALQVMKKVRENAKRTGQYWMEYISYRMELDQAAASNFHGISDNTLVSLQVKAKETLRNLNHVQDHHALFELLKYRLVNSGKISSEAERRKMQDLMLSEITLMAGKTKNSFLSHKLHLLFQSFFLVDIGDYHSALKSFHSLNKLFEERVELLDHPPLDYLSALNGIMDSLHFLKQTKEIPFYIEKATLLDKPPYPEYFRYFVKKSIAVYELIVHIENDRLTEAASYLLHTDPSVVKMYSFISEEKHWEFHFYASLIYFKKKDFRMAHQYILQGTQQELLQPRMLICKAFQLLNLMIYFERNDNAYLQYEIRSYKRFFAKGGVTSNTEKLLLRFFTASPDKSRKRLPVAEINRFSKQIEAVYADKFEMQLLKYFDFPAWVGQQIRR